LLTIVLFISLLWIQRFIHLMQIGLDDLAVPDGKGLNIFPLQFRE